jgi:hypothetical protein
MTEDMQNFVRTLLDRDEWSERIAVMKFGMPTLLESQGFLLDLIYREAERRAMEHKDPNRSPANELYTVMIQLGLELKPVTAPAPDAGQVETP